MRDAGHRTAEKAKIIYPPPRGVDIIIPMCVLFHYFYILCVENYFPRVWGTGISDAIFIELKYGYLVLVLMRFKAFWVFFFHLSRSHTKFE